MAGTFDSTRRAMTFAFAHSGSIVATRATLARTAIIFDARSDPSAMVLICIRILSHGSHGLALLVFRCWRASSAHGEVESRFRYAVQSAFASSNRDCFS